MDIAGRRLRNGRLIERRFEEPDQVVGWFGAVQAQDYQGAKWALSLRLQGTTDAELDLAFDRGEILRTHVLRPTWHFVTPDDLRWLLALTAPRVHKANGHRCRQLELDEATLGRGDEAIVQALEPGQPLVRKELAEALEANGVNTEGQRLAYLLMHAELEGLICSGPRRGKQQTHTLLDMRVPPAPSLSLEESLARLTSRYFTSHGPATVRDFAWWSGLTVREARKGLELAGPDLENATLEGTEYWFGRGSSRPPKSPTYSRGNSPLVHLLPNFDEHFVAYRDHGPSVDPRAPSLLRELNSPALGPHLVAVNGMVVGGWGRKVRREWVELRVDLRVRLDELELRALAGAAESYGRFIGLPPRVQLSINV